MSKEIKKKMTIGKSKKILRGFLEKDCYIDTPLYYAIPYILDYLQQKENIIKEVREYITSYESIETIHQCEHNENNKGLDNDTIIEMTNRHLKVHDKILEILDKENI